MDRKRKSNKFSNSFSSKELKTGINSTNTSMKVVFKKLSTVAQNKKSSKVKLGEIFPLKVNALGPKNMGLVELNNGLSILIPNTTIGDLVKVKLEKILPCSFRNSSNPLLKLHDSSKKKNFGKNFFGNQTNEYTQGGGISNKQKMNSHFLMSPLDKSQKTFILGSVVQFVQKSTLKTIPENIQVGKKLDLTIKKKGPKNSGLGLYGDNFAIIVPNAKVGQTLEVQITKIKANYAFASFEKNIDLETSKLNRTKAFLSNIETSDKKTKLYRVVLPFNALNKKHFFAFQLNGNFVFVKKSLGIELGDHILLKLLRIRQEFSIAKVVQILQKNEKLDDSTLVFNRFKKNLSLLPNFPNKNAEKYKQIHRSPLEQQKKVQTLLKKMVLSSMHYGERAIRCNANMRSYIWLRKKGKNKNRPLLKRGRHIINLFKTYKSLKKALLQLSKYSANGQTFLFVGTKKSASSLITRTAVLSKTSFFVNSRWLGGMLTNWKTILKSLSQIKPILKEKQKVIQNLLISRQRIKDHLLSKMNILRKKSKKFMLKGKKLIVQLQQNPKYFMEKNDQIFQQRNNLLIQNKNYIEKYSILSMKEQKILVLLNSMKKMLNSKLEQKKYFKNQILNSKKELVELKQLFLIGQELAKLQNSILKSDKVIWSISFEKFNSLESKNFNAKFIPNPSIEILNKIISIYYKKFQFNQNFSYPKNPGNQPKSNESLDSQPIILSKLLEKFLSYLPFMKKFIILSSERLAVKEKQFKNFQTNIEKIVQKFQFYYSKSLKYKNGLTILKSKLFLLSNSLKILKIKLSLLASEQRLFKFLPKLRYLPTTKSKIYYIIELLMKKFVDPKMSYVIDQIYDQKFKSSSKKIATARKQKWQRLEKYFGGVTQMSKMSKKQISNNIAIIIGQQEEMNAVRECKKLGIKMFTVVDTNCNPKLSDHIIPANDDSGTSIQYILGQMLTYIRLAQKLKQKISFGA